MCWPTTGHRHAPRPTTGHAETAHPPRHHQPQRRPDGRPTIPQRRDAGHGGTRDASGPRVIVHPRRRALALATTSTTTTAGNTDTRHGWPLLGHQRHNHGPRWPPRQQGHHQRTSGHHGRTGAGGACVDCGGPRVRAGWQDSHGRRGTIPRTAGDSYARTARTAGV